MTPQHDFTPWQPHRYAGLASAWPPITGHEVMAVAHGDMAIRRAMATSAVQHRNNQTKKRWK